MASQCLIDYTKSQNYESLQLLDFVKHFQGDEMEELEECIAAIIDKMSIQRQQDFFGEIGDDIIAFRDDFPEEFEEEIRIFDESYGRFFECLRKYVSERAGQRRAVNSLLSSGVYSMRELEDIIREYI